MIQERLCAPHQEDENVIEKYKYLCNILKDFLVWLQKRMHSKSCNDHIGRGYLWMDRRMQADNPISV